MSRVLYFACLAILAAAALGQAADATDPTRPASASGTNVEATRPVEGIAAEELYLPQVGLREFIKVSAGYLLISASCLKPDGLLVCQAYSALRRASLKSIAGERRGGADPGALLCRKLGGTLVAAHDERRNEDLMCVFADESMVSTDTIYAHAIVNERRAGLAEKEQTEGTETSRIVKHAKPEATGPSPEPQKRKKLESERDLE